MNKKSLVILLILLTGCATTPTSIKTHGPYPENYKSILKNNILRSFIDPYTLRNVSISTPVQASRGGWFNNEPEGWLVCVEANGKNRMGGYTGIQVSAFIVNNGMIVGSGDSKTTKGIKYQLDCDLMRLENKNFDAWPEMENLEPK